jgi:phosphatidylserine decarboxylase
MRLPVAREGAVFFAPPLAAGLLLLGLGMALAGGALLALALLLALFFRDPERTPAGDERSIVSPADGKVLRVGPAADGGTELSIFLSPLDVHINRAPVGGKLRAVDYRPGRYRPAYHPLASSENEQLRLAIDGDCGPVEMREVTGVLVRRIVLWKKAGDRLERGERIGLMKFGSRVDLCLPPQARVQVAVGDRVRGAESVIARMESR